MLNRRALLTPGRFARPLHTAWAQPGDAPGKKITMIVGFAPGGGVDVLARVVAQELNDNAGYQVVIDAWLGGLCTSAGSVCVCCTRRLPLAFPQVVRLVTGAGQGAGVRGPVPDLPRDRRRQAAGGPARGRGPHRCRRWLTAGWRIRRDPAQRRIVFTGLMLAIALPAFDLLILDGRQGHPRRHLGSSSDVVSYQIPWSPRCRSGASSATSSGARGPSDPAIVLFATRRRCSPVLRRRRSCSSSVARSRGRPAAGPGQARRSSATSSAPRPLHVAWITPTVYATAAMLGPFIGGFFVDHLTWRWIFFVNAPIGAVAFLHRRGLQRASGTVTTSSTLSIDVVRRRGHPPVFRGLHGGGELRLDITAILGATAISVLLVFLLIVQEPAIPRALFPLRLFRDRIVAVCTATTLSSGGEPRAHRVPAHLPPGRDRSGRDDGRAPAPPGLGQNVLASVTFGRVIARTGRYRWCP